MPNPRPLLILAMAILLVATGCSGNDDDPTTGSVPTADEAVEPTEQNDSEDDSANATEAADASGPEGDIVQGAVAAADALIAILSDEEIAELSYDYGDTTIVTSWSNLPACDNGGRAGIRHGNLSDEQVMAVLAVAEAVLSDKGFTNYTEIIAADEELGGGDGDVWDADCYYLAFFGAPSTTERWALQFGGHHYARTVTFADGVTTITPAFTGVEPRSFMFEGATVEPLADKSEAIFEIFDTLDDAQLAQAELGRAQTEILLGPGADSFPEAGGLLLSETSAETQAAVITAVREWVDDFETELGDNIMASIEADLGATTVSWSTATDIDTQDAYARIDGPSVWIEFINERGVGTGEIHQHSVYRHKTDDYGPAA